MSGDGVDISNLFTGAVGEVPDVPVEHLDYSHVEQCSDAKELTAILQVCVDCCLLSVCVPVSFPSLTSLLPII